MNTNEHESDGKMDFRDYAALAECSAIIFGDYYGSGPGVRAVRALRWLWRHGDALERATVATCVWEHKGRGVKPQRGWVQKNEAFFRRYLARETERERLKAKC